MEDKRQNATFHSLHSSSVWMCFWLHSYLVSQGQILCLMEIASEVIKQGIRLFFLKRKKKKKRNNFTLWVQVFTSSHTVPKQLSSENQVNQPVWRQLNQPRMGVNFQYYIRYSTQKHFKIRKETHYSGSVSPSEKQINICLENDALLYTSSFSSTPTPIFIQF